MKNYTPGPWKNDDGLVINSKGFCLFEYDSVYDAPGDADLIASAPELLEALKYAKRFLNLRDHDLAYIEHVIEKAEGNRDKKP